MDPPSGRREAGHAVTGPELKSHLIRDHDRLFLERRTEFELDGPSLPKSGQAAVYRRMRSLIREIRRQTKASASETERLARLAAAL
jgi:hypothetical protein